MNSADRFKCSYCDYESRYFNRLALHYKYVHTFDPGFRLQCGIDGCPKKYCTVYVSGLCYIKYHHSDIQNTSANDEVRSTENVLDQSNSIQPKPQEQNPMPELSFENRDQDKIYFITVIHNFVLYRTLVYSL